MTDTYYTFAFHSTHAAMSAQKLLLPLGAAIMPTLREISASCGMSLRVSPERVGEARCMMLKSQIERSLYELYRIEGRAGEPSNIQLIADEEEL